MERTLMIHDRTLQYWGEIEGDPFLITAIDAMPLDNVIERGFQFEIREIDNGVVIEMRDEDENLFSQYEFYCLAGEEIKISDQREGN